MEAAKEIRATGMSYRKAAEKFNINSVNLRRFCIRLAKQAEQLNGGGVADHQQRRPQSNVVAATDLPQDFTQQLLQHQQTLLKNHLLQQLQFNQNITIPLALPAASTPPTQQQQQIASEMQSFQTPPVASKRSRQIFTIEQEEELATFVRDTSDYYSGMSSKDVRTLAFVYGVCNQVELPAGWQETHQASFDWCLGFIKRNKLTPVMTTFKNNKTATEKFDQTATAAAPPASDESSNVTEVC